MKHMGLFAGIGGFELAARWMGWETVAWCEINPFCQKVLKHHFPNAKGHSDIKQTDFTPYANQIDILTGGFPCQPYSVAGKRKGNEDDRHLWPEMLRAIREVQPRWVVGENVRGLTNWNGGLVFDEVQADLETEGYYVLPFLLPACAVNAPHRRDRVWFVAKNTNYDGRACNQRKDSASNGQQWLTGTGTDERVSTNDEEAGIDTNATSNRLQGWGNGRELREEGKGREQRLTDVVGISGEDWQNFPTQPPLCSGDDGLPSRLVGITFPKHRAESIKGYGNAIVPRLALQIYKAIKLFETK